LSPKATTSAAARTERADAANDLLMSRGRRRASPRACVRLAVGLVILATCAPAFGAARASSARAPVVGVAAVDRLLAGIPEHGDQLGNPKAKVTLYEFGDLRCPSCRNYELLYLPAFIREWVRTGKVKVSFQLWPILGPDSVVAARAGLAAQRQNRFWQFAELFYENQGSETVHHVTPLFLDRLAAAARLNGAQFRKERRLLFRKPLATIANEAQNALFQGTPSFAVVGPKNGFVLNGETPTAALFAPLYRRALASSTG
jgi:protein-disulfide isomerase